MRTRSSKAKRCPVCGRPMRKNGRTTKGTQRWKCTVCSLSSTMPQERAARGRQLDAFLGWLLGRASQSECDANGDARALRKRTAWCWNVRPVIPPPAVRHHTVMADGTYINHDWCLIVAVDGESGEVLGFQWCAHESKAAYTALFSRIPAPDVLITDGLRGAETACNAAWPSTRIQRCLVHVQRNTRADLTARPRLQAGRELKKLSDRLTKVHDAEQAARWGEALNAWHLRWGDFVSERTFAKDDPTNPKATRQEWWWTHQEVRRCYRRLEKLFREGRLFAFLDPELTAGGPVARTTNRLEGGVNSPLKHVLLDHHGLPEEHMRRACEWVCYMKSGSPDPASLIRPEHWKPARPSPAEEDDGDGAPGYGTGISWDEFHTRVGRRFDC
ncbi:IS1249 family transposase [Bifidobacterium sp. SMB2]|uniref:IS1249 family transposase n=1 Tax=Bifidobacterium saimiriisciurei TaxID=2661627 RepID=A0ABX0CBS8_9BIFI|nr:MULTISPECIES: IS1249 family transposase [Bifidobacterium]NEG97115.1 IS1249 family transposase [Bifidobacterium sp. SMB2]NEH12562.1 IS1249 family transposase [Bifidobacterium saimiriisciurei]